MADEYILEMPKISIPDCSPEWVSAFFPALIKSIYDSYNGTIRKIVMDFNASFIEMEQEIQSLSKETKTANDTVTDLKSELSDKDYVISEQHSNITRLQLHLLTEMRPTVGDQI